MSNNFNPGFQKFIDEKTAQYHESCADIFESITSRHGKHYSDNVKLVCNLTNLQTAQIQMFCGNVPSEAKLVITLRMAQAINEVAARITNFGTDFIRAEEFQRWVLAVLKQKDSIEQQLTKEYFKNYKDDGSGQ